MRGGQPGYGPARGYGSGRMNQRPRVVGISTSGSPSACGLCPVPPTPREVPSSPREVPSSPRGRSRPCSSSRSAGQVSATSEPGELAHLEHDDRDEHQYQEAHDTQRDQQAGGEGGRVVIKDLGDRSEIDVAVLAADDENVVDDRGAARSERAAQVTVPELLTG